MNRNNFDKLNKDIINFMIFLDNMITKTQVSFSKRLVNSRDRKLKFLLKQYFWKRKFFFFKKLIERWYEYTYFCRFRSRINGELHTCDISEKNINNAKILLKNFQKYFFIDDSVNFQNFKLSIDFLYLDCLMVTMLN